MEVDVDRKMLADLAVRDPQAFSALVVIAVGSLDEETLRLADASEVAGIEEIDDDDATSADPENSADSATSADTESNSEPEESVDEAAS